MYLHHLHHFRGVAICGIVGAHALHNFRWDESKSLTFRIADTFCNESSVWFFFIAGFLFQYLSPKFRYGSYLKSKFQNVISPYLVMSIPALVASIWLVKQNSVDESFYGFPLWKQIALFLVSGKHLEPFWFVPTICVIYVLAGVMLKLDRLKWPYFALPIFMLLSAFLGRDGLLRLTELSSYAGALSKALYLFSVYAFGMFLGRYHDRLLAVMPKLWIPCLLLSLVGFIGRVQTYYGPNAIGDAFAGSVIKGSLTALGLDTDRAMRAADRWQPVYWMYLFKIASTPLLVYGLFKADRFITAHFRRALSTLGSLSFGLFFVHGFILAAQKMLFDKLGWPKPEGHLIPYLLFTAFVLALSSGILLLAQRLFGKKSRMIVGC